MKVNWASAARRNGGRPIQTPQPPGTPTYPGNQGGTNWYSPSYSPRTRLFYILGVGGLRQHLRRRAPSNTRRAATSAAAASAVRSGGRRDRGAGPQARADQQLDGSSRPRRRARTRSRDRRAEVEVRHDRCHGQRHPDHRGDLLFSGGREGYFSRSTRAPARCCGRRTWAADRLGARSPTRRTAGNTSRSSPA